MYGMYGYPQPSYYDYIRQQMQPQQAPPQSNALPAQQVIQVVEVKRYQDVYKSM